MDDNDGANRVERMAAILSKLALTLFLLAIAHLVYIVVVISGE